MDELRMVQSIGIMLAHASANHEVQASKDAFGNQADNTNRMHVAKFLFSAPFLLPRQFVSEAAKWC